MYFLLQGSTFADSKPIAMRETEQEIYKAMSDYIKNYRIKSYYQRAWHEPSLADGYTVIDYGSHSNFFYIFELEIPEEYLSKE